jgi:hypothetical protein
MNQAQRSPSHTFRNVTEEPMATAGVAQCRRQTLALGDDQERRRRLLLVGKPAVMARRLARPLAAELDESQQRAPAWQPEHEAIDVHHSRP